MFSTTTSPIVIAHSPDSDDAFMHYALTAGRLSTGERHYTHLLQDIETLNQWAFEGRHPVTAISIHAYAYLQDKYALLSSGASMGDGYGPRLIAQQPLSPAELQASGQPIAIPGRLTSAHLALKLWYPGVQVVEMPFDEILPAVVRGEIGAGVIIHEGQLTYGQEGAHLVLDFGVWWGEETDGLPLPLGGNAIRKDLGAEQMRLIAADLKASIQWALEHREEALAHALQYGRGLTHEQADEFVGMYVNELTVDYGERGRKAVRLFLDRAYDAGAIPHRVTVEFVD
ncbi:MAG: 1,4-dihydroxy-6-naphtoate synthase [bacterium]|nr:1,4-dihydroxy-6-naphtoate synthase [bacterium]